MPVEDTDRAAMKNEQEKSSLKDIKNLNITVIYDNNPHRKGLAIDWGFSCLIRGTEKTILFDTGELGTGIKEQSLLIYTGDGSIVIIEGTREIEPVRAGYGQGAFVVVKAKRAKPRTGD
jgi:hypothetical protein